MLSRLFSLAVDATPVGKILFGLKLLAVLLVVGAISYAVYSTYDAFASKRESTVIINAQKEKIAQKDGVIADQTKQAETAQQGKKVEDVLIEKTEIKQKSNNKKTAEVIEKLDHQVDNIQASTDFTPEEKSAAVAQVAIDSVWTSYCIAAGDSAAGCSAGTASPAGAAATTAT